MATNTIPVIRVFLSSPGDVNDERKLAISHMEWLANFKLFKNRVHIQIIAWDDPRYSTVMRASLTPQEAINRGLARPSECDIVLVIFWSRMGTPFTHTDGVEYQSGTHWELLDALRSKTTETVIYRRTQEKTFKYGDKEGNEQYGRVLDFFASELFSKDGKIVRGVNDYATPSDFQKLFEQNFVELVQGILDNQAQTQAIIQRTEAQEPSENTTVIKATAWDKSRSPFPGLRAFLPSDEDIFFGRTRETDELVKLVEKSRFVAVTGASGSGKSSLVGAGLIPRLRANAILDPNTNTSSQNWRYALMKPAGDKEYPNNPFASLYEALISDTAFFNIRPNVDPEVIKQNFLAKTPESVFKKIDDGLAGYPHSELLLFIDQFEELFTTSDATLRDKFIAFLLSAHQSENVRVVITMRNDFFPHCADFPDLTRLINTGNYLVSIPSREALREMIERPAERAGVIFADGLISKILDDTLQGGADVKGALALMAYALDEWYKIAMGRGDNHITFDDYNAIGGVGGAIGNRAQMAFGQLMADETAKNRLLQAVFHQLVVVDDAGTPTRKRWTLIPENLPPDQRALIDIFIQARLLVYDAIDQYQVILEVAHEALFRNWKTLAEWITARKGDLYTRDQILRDAKLWQSHGKPEKTFRYEAERLKLVLEALARLDLVLDALTNLEREFLEPEQDRLVRELENPNTTTARRMQIGFRLNDIGDTRPGVGIITTYKIPLPDMAWCLIPGGEFIMGSNEHGSDEKPAHRLDLPTFYMSRYLVTYGQYQTFENAPDFDDEAWWSGFLNYEKRKKYNQAFQYTNHPRETVTWYNALAFGRWLTHHIQESKFPMRIWDMISKRYQTMPYPQMKITLPSEAEYEKVARGADKRIYPYGDTFDRNKCNTSETGLKQTSAVGIFPQGESPYGVLDASGNVWKWTRSLLKDYKYNSNDGREDEDGTSYELGTNVRVLRGGSWTNRQVDARASYRSSDFPASTNIRFGFFVVCRLY